MPGGVHPRQQHRLLCSECGIVADSSVVALVECPNCGSKSLNTPRQATPRPFPRITHQPKFHTASRLRLDSLTIDIGERICLVGRRSKTVVERLCISALLPERHGGFGSRHVIVIDAGNSSDVYSCVNVARQYGLDIRDILKRIVVSRLFTIYQLAGLVIDELPDALMKYDTKLIIRDMLRMFLDDPGIRIDEVRSLVKDITDSLRRFKDVSVIVSLNRIPREYRMILPTFDKWVRINDDGSISIVVSRS